MRSPAKMTAGILLFLLAIARGIGGIVLLRMTSGAVSEFTASPAALRLVSGGLLLVSLVLAMSGIALLLAWRRARLLGLAALVLFVADGLVNGWVLYGAPRLSGVILNVTYALVVAACLSGIREPLRRGENS
ncbi:MAG: hypothetical protein WBX15_00760 [Thermoanaerobaculia bacterium]